MWNHKRSQIAKAILKNKTRGIILPDLKLYYKAMVIRTPWHLHKKAPRPMAQNWEPRNKPTCIRSINLWQRSQKHTTGKRPVSFINTVGNLDSHTQEKQTVPLSYCYKKINSKWLKTWKYKIPRRKLEVSSLTWVLAMILLDLTPQDNKGKNKELKLHQTKTFLHSTGNHQYNEWHKMLANSISDKGLISKTYKNSYSSIKVYMKRWSTLVFIREMQIKSTVKYHFTPGKIAIIKKIKNNKYWWGCSNKATLEHCWWECKPVQSLWKTAWRFMENSMEVPQKVNLKLPYDPPVLLLGVYPNEMRTQFEKDTCSPCSLQHYSQLPRYGDNLTIHQWKNGWRQCGVHIVNGIQLRHKTELTDTENKLVVCQRGGWGCGCAKWVKKYKLPVMK